MTVKKILPGVGILTIFLALLFWIPVPGIREFSGFEIFLYFLIVAFLDTAVLSYLILYSHWKGWKQVFGVFVLFYGVMTLMSQIETVVFLSFLQEIVSREEIPQLFIEGLIISGIYSPAAVFLFEKIRKDREKETLKKISFSPVGLVWKLILTGVIYMFIYILFGAFVFKPLAGEAFARFYGNSQLPVWIIPFQIIRGMIWGFLAVLVLLMIVQWKRARLVTALLFSIIMGTLLLVPNPYMPEVIRLSHFVEVTSSNFLFGWLAVTILRTATVRGG